MKKLLLLSVLSGFLSQSQVKAMILEENLNLNVDANNSEVEKLEKSIKEQRESIESMILALNDSGKLIAEINRHLEDVREIEKKSGIIHLEKELSKLRKNSCELQHESSEIKIINEKIEKVLAQIKNRTFEEEKRLKKLARDLQALDSNSNNYKKVTKKIEVLEKSVQEKTKDLRKQLNSLNADLRKIMSKEINQARPLVEELKKKHAIYKNEIKPHLNALKKAKEKISDLVTENKEIIAELEKLAKLRLELKKTAPCADSFFEAQQSWMDFII